LLRPVVKNPHFNPTFHMVSMVRESQGIEKNQGAKVNKDAKKI